MLDNLQIDLGKIRLQRMMAGVFSIYDPKSLEAELEELEHKCRKGTPLHRALLAKIIASIDMRSG